MTTTKHLHVIGIGGIGVSALARYYRYLGYSVSGSDWADSPFLDTLRSEWFTISIGHSAENLPDSTDLVIYSEAIITKPDLTPEEQIYSNPELARARDLGIRHISYPVALGEVFDAKQGIAITGSHGKSTTTAMTTIMLANEYADNPTIEIPDEWAFTYMPTAPGCSAIIGTQVPQLGNTNFYSEPHNDNFVIEACEYKRSFLQYHPYITVITNIDLDHLDYYQSLEDYVSAFQSLVDQTSGFVIVSADDENSKKLEIPEEKKIIVESIKWKVQSSTKNYQTIEPSNYWTITYFPRVEEMIDGEKQIYTVEKTMSIPEMNLQVPWDHLLHDAHLAYTVGKLLGMSDEIIVAKLESYKGSWRRSEIIRTTQNGNILMSDYGHHPNEIRPTLRAIRDKYRDKKLFVVFQPHQYSRTRELLQEFATSFSDTDHLIIPDIYFSRDRKEDVEWMTTDRFVEAIQKTEDRRQKAERKAVQNGEWLENTAKLIQEYDRENPNSSTILILGAGDVDSLRYEII
jgi:UDP-N-acetylmuramate--alanine ligase